MTSKIHTTGYHYKAAHLEVVKHRGKAKTHPCSECLTTQAQEWALKPERDSVGDHLLDRVERTDGTISHAYYSEIWQDYRALCRHCHRALDVQERKAFEDLLEDAVPQGHWATPTWSEVTE